MSSAEKYAEIARDSDPYNAAAFVCLGNCALRRTDFKKACDFFHCALENDAACVEALYNLGINHASILHPFNPNAYIFGACACTLNVSGWIRQD